MSHAAIIDADEMAEILATEYAYSAGRGTGTRRVPYSDTPAEHEHDEPAPCDASAVGARICAGFAMLGHDDGNGGF